MAVPKKRQGHARQASRRANWKATIPAINTCPNCGAPRLSHHMCGVCGFYKDRVVLRALQDDEFENPLAMPATAEPEAAANEVAVEAPADEEKPKKAAKKTKKAEEAPAEEANTKKEVAEEKPVKAKKTTKKAEKPAETADAGTDVDEQADA